MQNVIVTLRVLYRPSSDNLTAIYRLIMFYLYCKKNPWSWLWWKSSSINC